MSEIVDLPRRELELALPAKIEACRSGDWDFACRPLELLQSLARDSKWRERATDLRAVLDGEGKLDDALFAGALTACERGVVFACYRAGNILRFGRNKPDQATPLYRRACVSKSFDELACYYLALSFLEGAGVPQSPETALQFFRRACKAGHESSCDELMKRGEVVVAEEPPPAAPPPPPQPAPRQSVAQQQADADDDDATPSPPPRVPPKRERRRWTTNVSGSETGSSRDQACSFAKAKALGAAITACGTGGRQTGKDMGSCRCEKWAVSGSQCDVSVEVSCESDD